MPPVRRPMSRSAAAPHYALPVEVVPGLSSPWQLEPLVVAPAAVAAVCFFQGFVRLRRRGRSDHASWVRAALFTLGLAAAVLPLVSPLDELGDRFLLSAHMLQHVLIGDAAPALLLVSLRGPLLFFAVPEALLRAFRRASWPARAAAWLTRPPVALLAWAVAYGGWHVPAAYDYAARHQSVHDLEHASFVAAGLLVWTLLVDPARHGRLSRGMRLAIVAALLALGTVISDVLIFTLHPLYPTYAGEVHRVFGLSALRDQQLAGLVMAVEQFVTLGTCAALLLLPELRRRRRARVAVARQPA
jgi:putative membrane protein